MSGLVGISPETVVVIDTLMEDNLNVIVTSCKRSIQNGMTRTLLFIVLYLAKLKVVLTRTGKSNKLKKTD